jgi:hypothetical protein
MVPALYVFSTTRFFAIDFFMLRLILIKGIAKIPNHESIKKEPNSSFVYRQTTSKVSDDKQKNYPIDTRLNSATVNPFDTLSKY